MDGKIVGFRGQKVPTATGADPEIVQCLESALEQARRGEIEALLAMTVHGNDPVRMRVVNNRGRRHELVASLIYLVLGRRSWM